MNPKTNAELLNVIAAKNNEIKRLEANADTDDNDFRVLAKENKELRANAARDAKTISEKANDIEIMAMREESIEIQRVELYNENKELRAATDLHRAAWLDVRSCDSCTEMSNEIKLLREQAVVDAKTISEKDNKINDLRACMPLPQSYGITMEVRKDKEIKALHDQMRGLFHQVVEKDKEIKELGREVEELKAIIELAGKINKEFRGL
jgi:chromosome segregation ATPase